jgi:hypothetical protein
MTSSAWVMEALVLLRPLALAVVRPPLVNLARAKMTASARLASVIAAAAIDEDQ